MARTPPQAAGQPRMGPGPQRNRSYGRKMIGAGDDVNKSGQNTGYKMSTINNL